MRQKKKIYNHVDILTFFQYFLELDTSNAIKDANNL